MVVSDNNNNNNNNTINNNNINQGTRKLTSQLSEFLNHTLDTLSTVETATVAKTSTITTATIGSKKLDFEQTIDLTDILTQEQLDYRRNMPISDLLTNNQLNTINYGTTVTTPTQNRSKSNVKALVYLKNDGSQEIDENSVTTDYCESESTCDYDDSMTSNKRKAVNIGDNIDRVKRLSTTSSSSSITNENSTNRRGGRRGARVKSLLNTNEDSNENILARFGNKYVEKGTQEYSERRNKNNDAVKKCRAKLQEKQKEREKRLKELTEENRKLNNTVETLNKELSVLKSILSTMNPQYKMPNDIEEKIKRLENMIMANANFNNNNSNSNNSSNTTVN